jgi:hypothetical protein
MSASIGSFLVAALLTLAGGSAAALIRRRRARPDLDIRS